MDGKTRCNRTCTVAERANRRDLPSALVFCFCICFFFQLVGSSPSTSDPSPLSTRLRMMDQMVWTDLMADTEGVSEDKVGINVV